MWKNWVLLVLGLGPWAGFSVQAQQIDNDGFQRRNGQMYVVRNGQPRAMTRDAHLPTGTVVTKDGFLVTATGARTELREGQGCDLRGRPVSMVQKADGSLALAKVASATSTAKPVSQSARQHMGAEDILNRFFGDDDRPRKKWKKGKGHWKRKGKDRDDD